MNDKLKLLSIELDNLKEIENNLLIMIKLYKKNYEEYQQIINKLSFNLF